MLTVSQRALLRLVRAGVHRGWRGWRGEPSVTLPGPWACYLLVNFRPSVTQFTRTPPIATPALREPSTRRCEAYGPESTLSPSSGNSVLAGKWTQGGILRLPPRVRSTRSVCQSLTGSPPVSRYGRVLSRPNTSRVPSSRTRAEEA